MPNNAWVWGLLIVVAGVVVALAVWLGRGFKARFGDKSVEVEARRQPSSANVAQEAELEDVKAGDIAGVKVQGSNNLSTPEDIKVLEQGKIKKSEIGDIVGIKQTNGSGQPSPAKKRP
jgi:hypothetical protein